MRQHDDGGRAADIVVAVNRAASLDRYTEQIEEMICDGVGDDLARFGIRPERAVQAYCARSGSEGPVITVEGVALYRPALTYPLSPMSAICEMAQHQPSPERSPAQTASKTLNGARWRTYPSA